MTVDDATVVAAFVAHLGENGHAGLSVECRPDLENRESPEIDAIAGPFAIEHTSVDTIENQRRDGSWFSRVAQPLEDQFRNGLTFRLRLIFPYDGIAIGQDWNEIRLALAAWVVNDAPNLVDGTHQIRVPTIPFEFRAIKSSSGKPGLVFVRINPGDTGLPMRLVSQLHRKAEKLRPYKATGKTTVLLVESNDMAIMSHEKLFKAIQVAFSGKGIECVDQLWYADTTIEPYPEFWDLTAALSGKAVQISSS